MELVKPADKPIPIHDYEFTFSNGRTMVVTVFPTMGDIAKRTAGGWQFEFPRLHESQEVYRGTNLLAFLKREQMRVYVDPKEVVKRMNEAKAQKAADAKDHNGEES